MQAPTRVHHGIANPVLEETSRIFHHMIAFHPANGVVDPDANGRDRTIGRLLRWDEFSAGRFFLGLDDRNFIARIALEAPLLIETTATWQSLTFQVREACIIRLPCIRSTQETNLTGLIDYSEGFDCLTRLLATRECLLLLWTDWAVDRSCSPIRPNRGGAGVSLSRLAASLTAHSSAVRAGSSSW